jgi:predicted DNA-binding transcriptional regulator YafY
LRSTAGERRHGEKAEPTQELEMSDDIKIHDPHSREKEKQPYADGDVKNVMETRQFHNWDELLSFLKEQGDNVRGVTPGELKQMVEDFTRLKQKGAPFTNDPRELYERARSA